jgi:uncharacterized membrane protein SpoIIM required for sporulation
VALASAVTEHAFAERRKTDWSELDTLVIGVSKGGLKSLSRKDVARIAPLYRDVCADLSRAQAARYSAPLVEHLQALTASAHTVLYLSGTSAPRKGSRLDARPLTAFPRAVRKHWRAMAIAAALFFVPFALGLLGALADPAFAYKIVPEGMLRPLTEAYAKGFSEGRATGDDAMMAGFYVNNNVGIALRCFALGILGGLGSAIYLVQNGLAIGAILGYVAGHGAGANILTFIVGHGSLELGAIVIAGGAGLALGWSVVAPGEKTRLASLQAVGREVVVIVAGAAVMLLMAAGIEGFWSGSSVPPTVKRIVGMTLFTFVWAYLLFAGRSSERAEEERP